MTYYEEKATGNTKNILTMSFINKKIDLTLHPFKDKKSEEKVLFQNNWIPFKISLEKQNEILIINEQLTEEQAFEKAILKVKEKINEQLNNKEKILDLKCLKKEVKDSTIILDLFISVLEDITDSRIIEIGDENVGNNA